jgi:hypothetical protein
MGFSDIVRNCINNAWEDGYPCLLGTTGEDGPNVSPKGSMFLYDDGHLAYWERSKRKALENLRVDNRVIVFYSNMKAQNDGLLESGFLRFYGVAELHENDAVREAIFARLSEREATHVGADTGIGVLITIDRAVDVRGRSLL